jgi:hypothetical protein
LIGRTDKPKARLGLILAQEKTMGEERRAMFRYDPKKRSWVTLRETKKREQTPCSPI